MIGRRSFMAGILASGFAPAAIGSGVLMPVRRLIVSDADTIYLEMLRWAQTEVVRAFSVPPVWIVSPMTVLRLKEMVLENDVFATTRLLG